MAKTPTRFFAIQCCKIMAELEEPIFTYHGKLDYFCHKHGQEPIVSYLFWKGGLTKDEFEAFKKKEKEKNEKPEA